MDVVDQPVYLCVVGKTYVKHFTGYSEGPFLRLGTHRKNHVEVLQNFIDGDVYICVDPADPDCPIHARQSTGRRDGKLPGFTLGDRWGRGLLRRQFYRTCSDTPDDCEHCAREKKQFHSHEAIFTLADV